MINYLIALLIAFPTALYNIQIGNNIIALFLLLACIFFVYMMADASTKADQFLKALTKEYDSEGEEFLLDLMDEVHEEEDLEDKIDDVKKDLEEGEK